MKDNEISCVLPRLSRKKERIFFEKNAFSSSGKPATNILKRLTPISWGSTPEKASVEPVRNKQDKSGRGRNEEMEKARFLRRKR